MRISTIILFCAIFSTNIFGNYIMTFDNIQKIKKLECNKGLYYVVVDIDDNEDERVPLYKLIDGKEVHATCSKDKK